MVLESCITKRNPGELSMYGTEKKSVYYRAVLEPRKVGEDAAQVDPRSTHTLTVKSLSIDPEAIIFC